MIAIVHETDIIRIVFNGNRIDDLLELLEKRDISIKEFNFLKGNHSDRSRISFVISKKNIHSRDKTEKELIEMFGEKVSIDDSLGAVSVIGEGFSRDNKIIAETLSVLSRNHIDIYGLTTTSFRLSALIKKEFIESTVNVLHKYWIEGETKNTE